MSQAKAIRTIPTMFAGAFALVATASLAQGIQFDKLDPKRNYSPYPEQTIPNRVLFGDTHLHTSYSTDAGMGGQTVGPEDAFRFARGEEVKSTTGLRAKLRRPLDFLVLSDHAENLGLAPLIAKSDPAVLGDPLGKKWHDMVKAGKGYDAFIEWLNLTAAGGDKGEVKNPEMKRGAWEYITATADKYNEPGRFTSFIGFEWTSQPKGNNIHRVVIFRDDAKHANQVVPFSVYDSDDAEDLWKYMAGYEQKTGGRLLAIPHNGNLSNGLMFALEKQRGGPIDRGYAERRARWEPLVEVTQAKGTGEAHPFLSPQDEFASFEVYDKGNISGSQAKQKPMLQHEYARPALKLGLEQEAKLGVNPFKFGMVGSTDTHTALSTTDEEAWFGKAHIVEPNPERWKDVLIRSQTDPKLSMTALDLAASGLAAVWARENTREAIFDAMTRKEVYGTSGTRLLVRVFAGWDFTAKDLERSDFAAQGYARGVPMGGDLKAAPAGKAPTLLIRALRDPDGANLDRIQVVKGWLDAKGQAQEKVYDVAWSGNRKPGKGGKLPPVGNTVNVADASYTNSIGAPYLQVAWKDPSFDPKQRAFYYVRVIEIPTPRWVAYDAKFYKIDMPKEVKMHSQERAYTSPIWYSPGG
jgi:hypothetical protein